MDEANETSAGAWAKIELGASGEGVEELEERLRARFAEYVTTFEDEFGVQFAPEAHDALLSMALEELRVTAATQAMAYQALRKSADKSVDIDSLQIPTKHVKRPLVYFGAPAPRAKKPRHDQSSSPETQQSEGNSHERLLKTILHELGIDITSETQCQKIVGTRVPKKPQYTAIFLPELHTTILFSEDPSAIYVIPDSDKPEVYLYKFSNELHALVDTGEIISTTWRADGLHERLSQAIRGQYRRIPQRTPGATECSRLLDLAYFRNPKNVDADLREFAKAIGVKSPFELTTGNMQLQKIRCATGGLETGNYYLQKASEALFGDKSHLSDALNHLKTTAGYFARNRDYYNDPLFLEIDWRTLTQMYKRELDSTFQNGESSEIVQLPNGEWAIKVFRPQERTKERQVKYMPLNGHVIAQMRNILCANGETVNGRTYLEDAARKNDRNDLVGRTGSTADKIRNVLWPTTTPEE